MAITHIFYYIPEDNDDVNTMNFFTIQKPTGDITLTDI